MTDAGSSPPPALMASGLRYRYPHSHAVAVDDVSLTLRAGRITGFLGENGAGKSTTMHLLAGVTTPLAGQIEVEGRSLRAARATVGWAPEEAPAHPGSTVFEHLRFAADLLDTAGGRSVDDVITALDLEAYRHRLCGALSKGTRQRVSVAGALLGAPSVLLLDEPTAGLDPTQRQHLHACLRRLREDGVAMLISSHLTAELGALVDDVVAIAGGRTVFSGPASAMDAAVAACVGQGVGRATSSTTEASP